MSYTSVVKKTEHLLRAMFGKVLFSRTQRHNVASFPAVANNYFAELTFMVFYLLKYPGKNPNWFSGRSREVAPQRWLCMSSMGERSERAPSPMASASCSRSVAREGSDLLRPQPGTEVTLVDSVALLNSRLIA